MEQVEGCYGCRMLARRAADAQATIAALQARVEALEGWQDGVVTAFREAPLEWSPDLGQGNIPSALPQIFKNMHDYATKLTQRTAELEAAKREVDVWKEKAELRGKEACAQRAELERVRKKLGETKLYLQQERANRDSLVACVNRDVKTIKELRTLILTLPKVEGKIVIWEVGTYHRVHYCTSDGSVVILARFKTREDANKYAALLKHRQGMEAKHEE